MPLDEVRPLQNVSLNLYDGALLHGQVERVEVEHPEGGFRKVTVSVVIYERVTGRREIRVRNEAGEVVAVALTSVHGFGNASASDGEDECEDDDDEGNLAQPPPSPRRPLRRLLA